jgi:pterin-4a-carbinolamine dehydratase
MLRSEAYMIMRYADARETETHWHTPENYVQYKNEDVEYTTDQIAVVQNLFENTIHIHPIEGGVAMKDIFLTSFPLKDVFSEDETVAKAIEKYYKQRFHFFDLLDPEDSYHHFI